MIDGKNKNSKNYLVGKKQQETLKRNKIMQNDKEIIVTRIQATKTQNVLSKQFCSC